jgi:tetratricopeptide (TPR) repeat protein
MANGRILMLLLATLFFVRPVMGAEGPDVVGLSKTVLDLSILNQALKTDAAIALDEKEMAEAKLDACEDKLTRNITAQIDAKRDADACAAALSRVDKDRQEEKKILAGLRDENRRLDDQNHLLLKNIDKTRGLGAVIQQSSRAIVDLGDEKAALVNENERLMKLNAALELKAQEAVRKAEAIVSRKAAEMLRAVPRKVDVPRFIKDLKIKNARLGARNLQLTRLNAELERSSKEFFIRANALKERTDNSRSLSDALMKIKGDHEALRKEHTRVVGELKALRKSLDTERASLYREAGVVYTRAEFFTEAIDVYLESLKFDADDPLTYYYLGILYSKTGEQGRAAHYLRQYLQMEPKAQNREEVLYIISLIEQPGFQDTR